MSIKVAGDKLLVKKLYKEEGTIQKVKVFTNVVEVLAVGEGLKRKIELEEADRFKVGDCLLVSGVIEHFDETYVMPSQVLRWTEC